MKVARYLFPTSSHKYRRMYRQSRSSIFSTFGFLKLICKIIIYSISAIIGIIILAVSLMYKLYKRIKDYRHYKEIGINSLILTKAITKMNGRQFEIFTGELFKANGFKVNITQETCDGGKDIILKKDNITTYVECKRWFGGDEDKNGFVIGRVLLQKLIGSCIGDKVSHAIFITTSSYNSNAIEYAKKIDWLELWDLNDILEMLYKTDVKKIPWIMSRAMEYREDSLVDMMDGFGDKIEKFNNNLDKQY